MVPKEYHRVGIRVRESLPGQVGPPEGKLGKHTDLRKSKNLK